MSTTELPLKSSMAALRRFARRRDPSESCELCGAPLQFDHQHLLELNNRKIACSCDACAILFTADARRYRRIPRRIECLDDFRITEEQWESLHLPINLAFFYFSSPAQRVVAMFPSPAGATESLLTLQTWDELAEANPVLKELLPDVEALLVNRVGDTREYCRVPIDECFKLVGLIRTHWRGLSGGIEVWKQIALFFSELRKKSVRGISNA
jgi:hypothetical protein